MQNIFRNLEKLCNDLILRFPFHFIKRLPVCEPPEGVARRVKARTAPKRNTALLQDEEGIPP